MNAALTIANLMQKRKALNQERAVIYTILFFSALTDKQLCDLILFADFCDMKRLQSILMVKAYRLPKEELQKLPEHIVEKIFRKKDQRSTTALHWACNRGIFEVVDYLATEEDAPLNQKNRYGHTPLHCAAAQGDAKIVKHLLERGASYYERDGSGRTPLHVACAKGNTEAVRLLLGKGPFKASPGVTALHLACCNKETAELVYNYYHHGEFDDEALLSAIWLRNAETVRFLLATNQANVQAVGWRGETALLSACHHQVDLHRLPNTTCKCHVFALPIVQMLVEAGSPVNTTDLIGTTALHEACTHNSLPVVQYLTQQNGVDIHQKNGSGATPLQIACNTRQLAIVTFLWEQCGCGFADLQEQDLEEYKEPVRSYLKEQKAQLARIEREWKEEQERLLARRAERLKKA